MMEKKAVVVTTVSTEKKSYAAVANAQPKALAIYCFDPRFLGATEQFLQQELHLPHGSYVPLVVPGGIGSMSEAMRLPKEFRFMADGAKLALGHFESIERVVLVSHEDCAKYKALSSLIGELFLRAHKDLSARQFADLTAATKEIAFFTNRHLAFERYFAKFANPERTQVVFDKL